MKINISLRKMKKSFQTSIRKQEWKGVVNVRKYKNKNGKDESNIDKQPFETRQNQ